MKTQFERIVTEDGEVGRFIPDTVDVVIRTQADFERAKRFATLPLKKRFHHGRAYFMSSNEAVAEIIRDLSLIEAGALIKILLLMRMDNGGRLINANGKPLKKSDLSRVLERSRKATGEIVDRLLEIGVLDSAEDGCFVINSKYHVRGRSTITSAFTKMYTVRTREIVSELKLNEIGLLYKIIPFFHYSEYYLCVDSDCPAENIEFMGRETLAEAIGHAPATIGRIISRLQSVGAILVTGSKNEVRYLVHPDLMFRQEEGTITDWTIAVRKLFDDHAKKGRP